MHGDRSKGCSMIGDDDMEDGRESDLPRTKAAATTADKQDVIGAALLKTLERRDQIEFILSFLQSPAMVAFKDAPVEVSSSLEEIERKKESLEYQIEVFEALAQVLREELALVLKVAADKRGGSPQS
jgi:hypothetical protein